MSDFKGRHFRGEIVLWAVRWYSDVDAGESPGRKSSRLRRDRAQGS